MLGLANRSSVQRHPNVTSSRGGTTSPVAVEPEHVVDDQSFMDSLKELTAQISETNEQAVRSIILSLKSKKDIQKNLLLFDIVQEYFSNSFRMSDLCNALEDCLKRARDRQLILRVAVQLFKGEGENDLNKRVKYHRVVEELKKFKNAEDPFAVFSQILDKVREQQQSLVDKLKRHEKKIKKKLLILKVWRVMLGTILASVSLTLMICQVVVSVAGLSHVADALGSAASASSSLSLTLESKNKSHCDELKRELELISSMRVRAFYELTDLDEIHVGVDRLEKQLQSLMQNADYVIGGEEMAKLGFEEIEKSMDKFMKTLEELGRHADTCSNDLKNGRMAIQDKINIY